MSGASRSRTAFPPADVSLELEAALPMSSQSAPPSARVLHVDGFSWVFDEPVGDMLWRRTLRMMSSCEIWVCTLGASYNDIVSWRGRFSRIELNSDVSRSRVSLFENGSQTAAGDPELIEDVSLDSFACNFDDHPVTRRDEGKHHCGRTSCRAPRARGRIASVVC